MLKKIIRIRFQELKRHAIVIAYLLLITVFLILNSSLPRSGQPRVKTAAKGESTVTSLFPVFSFFFKPGAIFNNRSI